MRRRGALVLSLLGACGRPPETSTPAGGAVRQDGGPLTADAERASLDAPTFEAGGDLAAAVEVGLPSPDAGAAWSPGPRTSWQWQLTGAVDTSIDVQMYDVDLFDLAPATVEALHGQRRVVICYFSAGSHENWRPDASKFPAEAIGRPLAGWPGERWLDTRSEAVRGLMKARLDLAVAKKCDGVEPDNVDAYGTGTGFPLNGASQLDYNRFLAREAHARGLSVGLKNDLEQVEALLGDFDWALDESCLQFDECSLLIPFILAGKAVFHVEYGDDALAQTACPKTKPLGFSTLIKKQNLDAWRIACP
jgi:endo-alpha-1,4-polygalactosaminidase (GH114 family)